MTDIEIHLANLNDAQTSTTYRHLLNAYALDPMGGGQSIPTERLERVAKDLREIPHARVYFALINQQAIGFATCFTGYSTFQARPLINIHDIAVLAEHRGKGIARALLKKIARDAIQEGLCKITLEVREDNTIADALYRSEGFTAADFNGLEVQYLFLEKTLSAEKTTPRKSGA